MMHLNHRYYFKISLENKVGIIRRRKPFRLIVIIDNSEKIANEFNNFIVSIGHNLAKSIKQCVDTYVEPNTVLINNSFYHGIFPDAMKLARVIPIFKYGDSPIIYN